MEVLRSDLLTGFKNKLFETELEHVNDRNIILENNRLVCELSSCITKKGFRISGHLINNIINECDRCLCSYIVKDKIKVHFDIYNDSNSNDLRKENILNWPLSRKSINLKDFFLEILLVEVPFKKLCSKDCKGICIECGSNRNDKSCLCIKIK